MIDSIISYADIGPTIKAGCMYLKILVSTYFPFTLVLYYTPSPLLWGVFWFEKSNFKSSNKQLVELYEVKILFWKLIFFIQTTMDGGGNGLLGYYFRSMLLHFLDIFKHSRRLYKSSWASARRLHCDIQRWRERPLCTHFSSWAFN